MPARITVRAELQSLLNKSQALTDANRLQQLEAERRRREELAQLASKRRKAQEEARRRQELEDPVGRNKRTAAMGAPTAPVMCFWQFIESLPSAPDTTSGRVNLAPGNGQSPIATPVQLINTPILPNNGISFFLGPGGQGVFRKIEGSVLAFDYFPTGLDDAILWVGVAATYEQIDEQIVFPDFVPVSFTFTVLASAAYLISVTTITPVTAPAGMIDKILSQYRSAPATNGYPILNTKETSYVGSRPPGMQNDVYAFLASVRTPSIFATFDGLDAGIFNGGVAEASTLASLATIIGGYPGRIPNQHAGEALRTPGLKAVPGLVPPTEPGYSALFATHLNQRDFCQSESGHPPPSPP
jgi:hypothetical protein